MVTSSSAIPHPSLAIPLGRINELSDRAAMGLPESYVPAAIEELSAEMEQLRGSSFEALVQQAESPSAPLRVRLAAGSLLGWLGDPRTTVDDPHMITIPGGDVWIGLAHERVAEVAEAYRAVGVLAAWIEKETPRFQVRLQPYRIAKYAVTNAEFLAFLKDTGSAWLPTSWRFGGYPLARANHPVYTLPPEAADDYARWLSRRTGRTFRLPTEAEWEFAAAGPAQREFPWGDEFLPDRANTVESSLLQSTPVGIFPAGASYFGAADMAGNVEEYVADDYKPYPGAALIADDLVRAAGSYRVARGGSFTRFADLARCKRRHGRYPREIYVMGFRLAESL